MRVLAITIQGLETLYHHILTWGKLLKFYAALALPINLFWNRGQPKAAQVEPLAGIALKSPWSPGCPLSHTLDKLCWGLLGPKKGACRVGHDTAQQQSTGSLFRVAGFIQDGMHTVARLGVRSVTY